ncbi:MAG TPA: hypothetical protein PKN76_02105, partial [bacterium]|nr:hypothetical protein [bacterium]
EKCMKKEKIFEWLHFYACEPPEKFSEYFYDDIFTFLENNDLKSKKIKELMKCKSREEVKVWLDKVTGFIIMKMDIETILENYFSGDKQ